MKINTKSFKLNIIMLGDNYNKYNATNLNDTSKLDMVDRDNEVMVVQDGLKFMSFFVTMSRHQRLAAIEFARHLVNR